ncbi:MAG: radical SAM protein [Candidatus Omnitrophica bacterium]|nr:radical SAM protein [Candidatus Omnitrophota bacterium]
MKRISVLDYLKLRVLSYHHEAEMLKKGKMPPPRMAILYPTYLCNHRCIGCDYTELNETKHSLGETEFMSVIDQLIDIGIKGIEFCGGGEPTLNSSLPKVLDRLISSNVSFGILTNGTNLTPELREKLVKYGSYCRVSLESASEKVFNAYKRPVNEKVGFKKVIANLENLIKLRDEHKKESKLQISMKYSIDSNNYKDVVSAVALAGKIKVDSLQFKLVRNMPSELKNKRILSALLNKIESLRSKYPRVTIIPDFDKTALKINCWLSPLQLVVDPFGNVYICCYYRHRAKEHCLGNMLKTPLRDIWYSHKHWSKIRNIKKEDCNKYDCRFHYYNELMQKLVIDDIGQLNFI